MSNIVVTNETFDKIKNDKEWADWCKRQYVVEKSIYEKLLKVAGEAVYNYGYLETSFLTKDDWKLFIIKTFYFILLGVALGSLVKIVIL